MIGAVGSRISADEKIRALEDILQSDAFMRSERLKGLLRFLCEAEIQGKEGDLNEYTIGTMALGRPADFCPLEDSSVRSRAHELRQRLEKYYTHEAPNAALRIELRKGSYVPRFSCARAGDHDAGHPAPGLLGREQPAFAPESAAPGPSSSKRLMNRWRSVIAFLGGAAAVLAILPLWPAGARLGLRGFAADFEPATAWTPELNAFWRPFFAHGTPLLIVFETRFFVRVGPLMVRDWRVNGPDAVKDSESLLRAERLFEFRRYGDRDYTDAGTPQALFCLTRLLSTRVPMALKNSLDVTAADLRDNSVILLGKPGMDPEIAQTLSRGELVDQGETIVNIHPRPGEQAEYHDRSDPTNPDRWSQKYSVITMMPGSGPQKRILTLTASGSEQPAALAYYLTNPESVRDLVARLRSPRGELPDSFQILVRAEYKSKAVVKVEYITHRILKLG